MKFLFWNINRKPLINLIVKLSHIHEVDVLMLAESELSEVDLLLNLNQELNGQFNSHFSFSDKFRLQILSRLPVGSVHPIGDDYNSTIRRITPPIGKDFILVLVHLRSKLYANDFEQTVRSIRLMDRISEVEKRAGHTRTIIAGDFNMNPFESGLVAANSFHAVMDRRIAKRISRVVGRKNCKFFYNPMWCFLGDRGPCPPGTYYYANSGEVSFFWNIFDQVLLRPDLLEYFNSDGVQILTSVGSVSLLTGSNLPDTNIGSDHLPLLFELKIEKGV
jgi:endonuclease/exonuclease/phosphatase family metal-dependent hydrolase